MINTIKKDFSGQMLKDARDGKEIDWKGKKIKTLLLADSYRRLGMKKSFRVKDCAVFLEFKRFEDNSLKLNKANFCKVRLCPMCSWRRSKKIFSQVSQVMDLVTSEKSYRFLFLTLTVKNCEPMELKPTMDNLFKAFKKLTERKEFKAIKGFFRALEITYNEKEDTYHPHFHAILQVNPSYFKEKTAYLSQAKWSEIWKSCLQVDYMPIVDIRRFKDETKTSIAEVAKYTVKDVDFLKMDEQLTDNIVYILDNALKNRRLVAFGGMMKQAQNQLRLEDLEKGDLIITGDENIRTDLEFIIERYRWNIGFKDYIKLKV